MTPDDFLTHDKEDANGLVPRILKFGWKLELQKLGTCSPLFRFYSHDKYLQFLEGIN